MQNNKMTAIKPIDTDLVLIGGGHSHLILMKHLSMTAPAGLRVTLITRDLHTPYSGMLPGFVAGHYDFDQVHIDLAKLASFTGIRIIHAEVNEIDADNNIIRMPGRPDITYDLLSINIGSRPSTPNFDLAANQQVGVKPVDDFIRSWKQLEKQLKNSDQTIRLAVIGAGAGGVELALSLQYRALQLIDARGRLDIALISDSGVLLPTHNQKVQSKFDKIIHQRKIKLHLNTHIDSFDGKNLLGQSTTNKAAIKIAADRVIWVTPASASSWLKDTGLALDKNGFIALNPCLQSTSHDNVFAAGDIASVEKYPRPKSGVFAVRQGLPLAKNIILKLQQKSLIPFKPQHKFLSLISTGDKYAVASRGIWAFQGHWCWWLKDKIDTKFMERFRDFSAMNNSDDSNDKNDEMRCGGCGSKVGAKTLERVLNKVAKRNCSDKSPSKGQKEYSPEDAEIIEVPVGKQLIQTVDYIRSFIDDPYTFGKIAANHALGDLYAMGITADSAMVIATVGFASEAKQAEDLFQMMSGIADLLDQDQTGLAGGHSSEAAEMACGLSVNGFAVKDELLLKSGMAEGDLLILTKPLGSGIIFAANMRAQCKGEWVDKTLVLMQQSSRQASVILKQFSATACTDVTGFGFAGHLTEMAQASACKIEVWLDQLPAYAGAVELSNDGYRSSLFAQNHQAQQGIGDFSSAPEAALSKHAHYELMFDPQTAGGLLASLPADKAKACLKKLIEQGYPESKIVGRVLAKIDKNKAKDGLLQLIKDS